MYFHPTQPKTPRLCNCPQLLNTVHNNWDVHFTIIDRESAHHITSLLYTAYCVQLFISIALFSIAC